MSQPSIGPRELIERLGDWQRPGRPLAVALSRRMEELIRTGALPPGVLLPSERRLAERLGLARGTVGVAFAHLRRDAMIRTRRGSGSTVAPGNSPVSGPREAHLAISLHDDSIVRGQLTGPPGEIDLRAADWHGIQDLPDQAFDLDLREQRRYLDAHGYELRGVHRLRSAIAQHLTAGGLATSPDDVLVTAGAQQAISLVVQLVLGRHDVAIAEELTYPGAADAIAGQQARLVGSPIGPNGLDLASFQRLVETHQPRLAYLMPSVHNPTGRVTPGPVRARLVELAADWSMVMLDDRTLADTQVAGSRPLPLAAYADEATARRIVTVGSMSKAMWGGLRVGWIRADAPLLDRLLRLRSVADLGSPVQTQLIAAALLERAEPILRARQDRLRARLELVETKLADAVPAWRWRRPDGGLCLWIDLGSVDAEAFCDVARRHGVGLAPSSLFAVDGSWGSWLRLPFGHPPDVLCDAIDRLGAAWGEATAAA